ncbi:hypothetical protein DQW50_16330 [Halorubrum sp. 48-1-W]|uniref:hypothetical protein n=1 Tax=Halorubrum sp. 48-1-W TaxID=2249761 RepID=UPI000DCF1F20|nr:hypothetical protein [Halorubrum sp. 48-1-W]RAW44088.1 hypothetical protein DQW50_16330 [Halorubrum sp. 48-1-W]
MGLIRNGEPSPEEMREEQKANQDHGTNLQFADDGQMDAGYIDKVTNSQLQQGTVDVLANLLSKDFVLGNLSEAEVHEHRWLTREIVLEVEAEHPSPDSMWQGRFRQVASGRERDALEPLDGPQKTTMQQFIQGVIARATRSRDGWQQEEVNKSYRVSERREPDKDDGGFL